ncbi:unnamed protein product [Macrosiphum euphorbiae]|uniref:RNA-directed DNA polymerase n=1 Tax=Macrosiphum euphorbiae TaxID=13131 RepID=A0AAV0XYV1_9HEMI|nr:unnamed protein product [Macrosiphum euphorbiae]
MDSWMKSNPGKRFTIYDLPSVTSNALVNAATPKNIINGFSVSGVWPFNRNVFNEDEYAPSTVTNILLNNTDNMHTNETSENTHTVITNIITETLRQKPITISPESIRPYSKSPAIFQRILSNIIRKYELTIFTVNYIDDILIFSKTFEKHLEHLKKLLDAIIKEGFKLNLSKCFFATDTVNYLGHIIGYNTVRPMTDNLKSIMDFPTPTTQKNIRQFLSKINFYHEYVPKVATILEPLHRLLRKNQTFIWSQECQKAFNYLKNYLCKTPILTIYDPKLPIKMYTDGSIIGLGGVLKQPQSDNNKKPVAYFSKKLTSAQSKKKPIYLEVLAIKEAIKFWQYWLIGRYFEVYSDHKPLKDLNIKARPDEKLGDLTYYMSQFDFKVIYNPGKFNIEADCLSRHPVLEADESKEDILKTVNIISLENIKED